MRWGERERRGRGEEIRRGARKADCGESQRVGDGRKRSRASEMERRFIDSL